MYKEVRSEVWFPCEDPSDIWKYSINILSVGLSVAKKDKNMHISILYIYVKFFQFFVFNIFLLLNLYFFLWSLNICLITRFNHLYFSSFSILSFLNSFATLVYHLPRYSCYYYFVTRAFLCLNFPNFSPLL